MITNANEAAGVGPEPRIPAAPATITVSLDAAAAAALASVTAEGATIHEAVRAALVESATRRDEQRRAEDLRQVRTGSGDRLQEWARRQVAKAPPPTDHQIVILRAAFLHNRILTCTRTRPDPECPLRNPPADGPDSEGRGSSSR